MHIDGDHDRKAKIDEHKDDQLNKQKEGKGHWKKELSSNSEAAVCLNHPPCLGEGRKAL